MWTILNTNEILTKIPFPDPALATSTDPVKVSYVIPNYVYIGNRDDIKVGLWD